MALSAAEEAQARELIAQQAALLSLAGNEATITSKLGATKVNVGQLPVASALADADLLLTRQGTNDKSLTAALLAQYCSEEFLAGITTPPQFDNDTSLATTAFVQRALGNFSGIKELTLGANALLAADCGKLITHRTTAGVSTATLPPLSDVPVGGALLFKSTSSYSLTLSRSGADLISANGTNLTSVVVQPGDDLLLIKVDASYWFATGSAVRGQEPGFGSSLTASGYQKLPSGLIIQWGLLSSPGLTGAVTLPIAMPANTRAVLLTPNVGAAQASNLIVVSWTTSDFNFAQSINGGFSWFAIGH